MGLARKHHSKHPKPAALPAERFPLNVMDSSNIGKNKVV